ncbi:Endocytosis and vacuole integrity protein [Marasmius sp. AFHP31]|nr:Endocytosis and vacuole integrity protein [Marasmius sp. AFHP31]
MSSLAFLVTELQSLASETRRKHPEVREAAEKSLAILRSSPEQATTNLASDGPQSDDLLKPVFMGCATKNAKVVAISLGSLQRLIALKAVPESAVPLIIKTMSDAMSQGVDIQLKILQTLLSLITNFPTIHGALLGDALLLCFKLQESKIAVVSSTAAATLRQLVMFVVDKMVEEDRRDNVDPQSLSQVTLPNGESLSLGPSSLDAYAVFEDLCLLANSEKPNFLKLEFLHKTFALELIESVLTNYHALFKKHEELILLLRHHLCPLLLKALSDRATFPLTLRCTRVAFLLLKQFSGELETEAEVFLMLLIRIIADDADGGSVDHTRPPWVRVLAMEIMRGLCGDAELIRNVWDRYDSHSDGGSKVFTSLVTALKRLITEKPALLGVGSQMFGIGVPHDASGNMSPSSSSYGLDVGGMAGMVATAASATVSNVVGMMSGGGGLSLQGSTMKLQCIDQLDKADAPPIPESYIYLLALQCLVSLCEGLAAFSAPLYTSIVIQRPRDPGSSPVRAPPALDINTLPQEDLQTKQLRIVRDIIENGWPALLAALSFIIATNLSDELFVDVLASYQAMTNVSGMLGLTTPRDAFFTSLSKFSVPTRVVSSVDSYIEPQTPRTASSLTENFGLGGGATQPPGLSERNLACLKVLISSAMFLAGSLGESWFGILEVLQNADYVLSKAGGMSKPMPIKRVGSGARPMSVSGTGGSGSSGSGQQGQSVKHPLLSDLDTETMLSAMQRLFDASKNLEDDAFKSFVGALCKLSAEMVGMQTDPTMNVIIEDDTSDEVQPSTSTATLTPSVKEPSHRRRVSGIHIPRTLRSGDFGLTKLGQVSLLNVHRLIYRAPEIAWNTTTGHLLSIINLTKAPQPIRVQAAEVLDEILVVVPRNLSNTGERQAEVQKLVLDVLAKQVVPEQHFGSSVELRRMGLETLHQILQSSGHTLVVGWETIFHMLESVCKPPPPSISRSGSTDSMSLASPAASPIKRSRPLLSGLGAPSEKSSTALIKIAFQSLTLVCDSISLLSPTHLRLCITTLGHFGRQTSNTNIALTAAASLLWSVSDAIQAKRKDEEKREEYSEIWMVLLLELLGLCTDSRKEVRDGAIQTMFRTMQLYGETLSEETWDQCVWKVTFPLLDALTEEIRKRVGITSGNMSDDTQSGAQGLEMVPEEQAWDESKILAFQSIGSIFHDFLGSKIIHLESFTKAWDVFTTHIQDSVLLDNRTISTPALRCLEKVVKAASSEKVTADQKDRTSYIWQRIWDMLDIVGGTVIKKSGPGSQSPTTPDAGMTVTIGLPKPFTQESLVALVDVVQCTRALSRALEGQEWPLERLERLMVILKGVLMYSNSLDYRPDIDALPPLQTVVMDAVNGIDLSTPGSPSMVLKDLAEFTTLPFLAAFDVPQLPGSQTPKKKVTYIALAKKTMPLLVDLVVRFKDSVDIYVDGTIESVLTAYSIPIKLKYDCPAPSKHGKDEPLWKTATTCFLRIVKEIASRITGKGEVVSDECVAGIWRQILDVFKGGILADCTPALSFPLEAQESEENFDLALLSSLEIDVLPYLGDSRIPDDVLRMLPNMLSQGSRLYEGDYGVGSPSRSRTPELPEHNSSSAKSKSSRTSSSGEWVDVNKHLGHGSTHHNDAASLVPRERFSYWCFDLLFLVCSDVTKDQEPLRKRLAALSLLSLFTRCKTTLVGYVADEALRGNLPFPRAREDELIYVLRKLLELRLWPGSHWAAISENPTSFCVEQPPIDPNVSTPKELISDSVKRSSLAHLFYFYPVMCEIAAIPRKMPSSFVNQGAGGVKEVDARSLSRECLRVVGKEMGVS